MTTSTSPTSSSSGLAERLAGGPGGRRRRRPGGRPFARGAHDDRRDEVPPGVARARARGARRARRGGEPAPGGAGEGGGARRPRPAPGTSSGSCRARRRGRSRRYASVIHSVDRAVAGGCAAPPTRASVDCFVQLNLTDDPGRGGVADRDLEPLVRARPRRRRACGCSASWRSRRSARSRARVRARPRRLATASGRSPPTPTAISAGMSQDYREAIAAGRDTPSDRDRHYRESAGASLISKTRVRSAWRERRRAGLYGGTAWPTR